jgi:RHH-type proline utilization regulon transcriptional repressor/proline dehydrogenase/delta 1-pyrroline-5-carboxylate dehydrogenase
MRFQLPITDSDNLRQTIRKHYHADETWCVHNLLENILISTDQGKRITATATALVNEIRNRNESHGGLDAFLQEFSLSSQEGVALMCLAEALLRVPDAGTADQLIHDKLAQGNWESHLGESESFFVNASTWGLMLTGKVISLDKNVVEDAGEYIGRLIARSGEPIIRTAVKQAMKIMGRQFVLAQTIQKGLRAAREKEKQGYCYSYDMLGEAARTEKDALQYYQSYQTAIAEIGASNSVQDPHLSAGISVKLSALHPRYEYMHGGRVMDQLLPRITMLCEQARSFNIGLTIDAEESERLDLSLDILRALCENPALQNWNGLGFVIQAYQKRAPAVIDWIRSLASRHQRRIMIRLVKGAYWDTEIKRAQVEGYSGYPVFTRKIATDVSYLVCAQKLMSCPAEFYPLFATHNAHTVASILEFAGDRRDFEFQCLHGMGEILYDHVIGGYGVNCRIYAPVGPHRDLLAYLVRRLLENGANSSFVNRLVDRELPVERIVSDPVSTLREQQEIPHPNILLPRDIYAGRANSMGMCLDNALEIQPFFDTAPAFYSRDKICYPLVPGIERAERHWQDVISPSDQIRIGKVSNASEADVTMAVEIARQHWASWDRLGGVKRAEILRRAADNYEANRYELFALCMQEAGKTLQDSVAEIREAVDFLRYYADQAERDFEFPRTLSGATGELDQWSLHGRGVFVCISPWNFPLAIFTGQVSAALAAGNAVLAKPAEQTPVVAFRATQILHHSGVPAEILQLLPGDGVSTGATLVQSPGISGVVFTGSTDVASIIHKSLAQKPGPIVPLIAETGGLNAMIVDSTALPEQVARDVIQSAFQSAGQRCSALRVLYLQEDIADEMIEMLKGAMQELKIGDPAELDTDVGPIIDEDARRTLVAHIGECRDLGRSIYKCPESRAEFDGYYLSPALIEISGIEELSREQFGPVLHVCRFKAQEIDSIVDRINDTGYGLTFGLHSRIQSTVERVTARIRAGNIYVNRNTIGAVVGVQPFGGEGLSGTGPKAGGPHYLHRFAVERSISTDTTAAGGNTSLLSLSP